MCNNMRDMARINGLRYVSICEHGNIHLSWDQSILFLTPSDLVKVGIVLDLATVDNHQIQGNWRSVKGEESGDKGADSFFVLWIGNYAFRLAPIDYLMFGSMVSQSIANLPWEIPDEPSPLNVRIEAKSEKDSRSPHANIFFSKN